MKRFELDLMALGLAAMLGVTVAGCATDDGPAETADVDTADVDNGGSADAAPSAGDDVDDPGADDTSPDTTTEPDSGPTSDAEAPDSAATGDSAEPSGCSMDCTALGDMCSTFVCNEATGSCEGTPVDCDDGIGCTTDDCDGETGCTHAPDDGACDDGDSCTDDSCTGDGCETAPNAAPCDDGDACTKSDTCSGGTCAAGQPMGCPAPTGACEIAACDPATGECVTSDAADGTVCDDGLLCSQTETCQGGVCAAEPEAVCECANDEDCAASDDGNTCNGTLVCDTEAGECVVAAGSAVTCEASTDPCEVLVCDPANGLCSATPVADGVVCDDGDSCTVTDTCTAGTCAGLPMDCDDENPCTTDQCDAGSCTATDADGPCDDGDACTDNDACASGSCAGQPLDCSGFDDDCHTGVCNAGTCGAEPTGECSAMDELPADSDALFAALQEGVYLDWEAEPAPHPSAGPHGTVQTYVNSALAASLGAGNASHPAGSAVVKELIGGGNVTGWAAMIKVLDGDQGGAGWYWWENFSTTNNSPVIAQTDAWCAGCHSSGSDYVLIPYPFE